MIRDYHATIPEEDRLCFGIDINTGEAVAGNVGGEEQMDYTLIGDAVNLSRRLQENAGPNQILLGKATYELVKSQVKVEMLDRVQVKGRTAVEQVYSVLDIIE